MSAQSPAERTLHARVAAHTRWARTDDRTAATAAARKGLEAKFAREVDPEGRLDPVELAKRIESARKAYYAALSLKSAAARRQRKAA